MILSVSAVFRLEECYDAVEVKHASVQSGENVYVTWTEDPTNLGIHVWSANITVETHQQTYEQFWSNIAPRMVRTVHDWGFHKFLLHNKLDRQCCTVAFADINLRLHKWHR